MRISLEKKTYDILKHRSKTLSFGEFRKRMACNLFCIFCCHECARNLVTVFVLNRNHQKIGRNKIWRKILLMCLRWWKNPQKKWARHGHLGAYHPGEMLETGCGQCALEISMCAGSRRNLAQNLRVCWKPPKSWERHGHLGAYHVGEMLETGCGQCNVEFSMCAGCRRNLAQNPWLCWKKGAAAYHRWGNVGNGLRAMRPWISICAGCWRNLAQNPWLCWTSPKLWGAAWTFRSLSSMVKC